MAPGEHGGWIAVDPSGNPVSGGMVCTPEVCGQTGPGSFVELLYGPDTNIRLVLQTLQDPEEARRSPNGVGNVATYSGGTYNFDSGEWTMPGAQGEVYRIPLAYPGADLAGNVSTPVLVFDPNDDESDPSNETPISPIQFPQSPERVQFLAELRDTVSSAITPASDLEEAGDIRFTEAAEVRRTNIVVSASDALLMGSSSQSVEEAQRLLWLYTWAAVRELPESQRADMRNELRSTRINSPEERAIRELAASYAKADLVGALDSLAIAPEVGTDQCSTYLVNAQGRMVRENCVVTPVG